MRVLPKISCKTFFWMYGVKEKYIRSRACCHIFVSLLNFQVARHLKKGRLNQSHDEHLMNLRWANTTEDEINYKELNGRLFVILDQLPLKCKEVFCLSRFNNLSNKEIAQQMNLSHRTVEWHISNALKHIRISLDHLAIIFIIILPVCY